MSATSRLALRLASIVIPFWIAVHGGRARAADAIAPTFDDVAPRETAEATYSANAYTIVHVGATDRVNEPGSSWRPVRGLVYRLAVDPDAYFASLGRLDLARADASRRALGRGLVVGGILSAVAGVVLVPWGIYKGHTGVAIAGGGLLVGGVLVRHIGEGLEPPTFPEDRAIDMAARYNEALRAHLGASVGGRF
jgi:hypothetical protein